VFIETVIENRGDRIELSREEVATAKVFLGIEAVENGMVDEIGSLDDAVRDAAERAEIEEYEIVNYDPTPDAGGPTLIQTDEGLMEIRGEKPGYGDIRPVQYAFVYEPAIPHYSTIEKFAETAPGTNRSEQGGELP
jgi:protease-4